jgi:hypothetical protein
MKFRLVYKKGGHPARVGDPVTTIRGCTGRLMDWKTPKSLASSGRVYVMMDGRPKETRHGFYPVVIGARFVEVEEPDDNAASQGESN